MIVEYIRYSIAPDQQPAFLQAMQQACAILQTYPACLRYEVTHCHETPDNFIWRIEWTSLDDHLNGFRKSAEFQAFVRHVGPFFTSIQEMNHYNSVGIAGAKS